LTPACRGERSPSIRINVLVPPTSPLPHRSLSLRLVLLCPTPHTLPCSAQHRTPRPARLTPAPPPATALLRFTWSSTVSLHPGFPLPRLAQHRSPHRFPLPCPTRPVSASPWPCPTLPHLRPAPPIRPILACPSTAPPSHRRSQLPRPRCTCAILRSGFAKPPWPNPTARPWIPCAPPPDQALRRPPPATTGVFRAPAASDHRRSHRLPQQSRLGFVSPGPHCTSKPRAPRRLPRPTPSAERGVSDLTGASEVGPEATPLRHPAFGNIII
jgi:hypothetical protein